MYGDELSTYEERLSLRRELLVADGRMDDRSCDASRLVLNCAKERSADASRLERDEYGSYVDDDEEREDRLRVEPDHVSPLREE